MTTPTRFLMIAATLFALCGAAAHNHNPEKCTDRHEMAAERRTNEMAKSLALTDVQKRAVHDLNRQRAEAFRAVRHDTSLTAEQRQACFDEADDTYRTKLKTVLTPQQYDQCWSAKTIVVLRPFSINQKETKSKCKMRRL